MKRPLVITENHGGLSADSKQGTEKSFAYSKHIDFRKRPTAMSILPKATKETSTTVTGLITEMIQLPSGKMVAIDSSGGIYTRSTAGSWAKFANSFTDTAAGMVYDLQTDTIFVPGLNAVHSITNADGRFSGGTFTRNNAALTFITDQSSSAGHASTYTTTGSITETATHMLLVTPTIEPMYSIGIWVTTKGTGDLTVTMHDAANNVLGTSTIANASLTNGAYNYFVFTTPVRNTVKPTATEYHFHITHPSGTASTIGTATVSDFALADYVTKANRLINPINDLHPAMQFLQYMLIGNERYVAAWEIIATTEPTTTEFNQHRLVFPSGYEVTSMATWTEYAAFACEKKSSVATNEFQEGKIFFWDGTSQTYNFIVDVPEGSPYGLYTHKNTLHWFAGGSLWAWSGGNPVKVFQMPYTDTEYTDASYYMINYPNTMSVRNGILMAGFPSETNSTTTQHGIYSYGARNRNYNESIGYSYTISTGNNTNGTLRIGMVKSFGAKMFVSWRDDTTYGVDIIDANSDPFGTATWESLIFDAGRPDSHKQAVSHTITFETLPTGATVTPKYKIDRGSWVTGTAAVAGDTSVMLNINKRFNEIQLGLDLVATTATPVITSNVLIYEDLQSEKD